MPSFIAKEVNIGDKVLDFSGLSSLNLLAEKKNISSLGRKRVKSYGLGSLLQSIIDSITPPPATTINGEGGSLSMNVVNNSIYSAPEITTSPGLISLQVPYAGPTKTAGMMTNSFQTISGIKTLQDVLIGEQGFRVKDASVNHNIIGDGGFNLLIDSGLGCGMYLRANNGGDVGVRINSTGSVVLGPSTATAGNSVALVSSGTSSKTPLVLQPTINLNTTPQEGGLLFNGINKRLQLETINQRKNIPLTHFLKTARTSSSATTDTDILVAPNIISGDLSAVGSTLVLEMAGSVVTTTANQTFTLKHNLTAVSYLPSPSFTVAAAGTTPWSCRVTLVTRSGSTCYAHGEMRIGTTTRTYTGGVQSINMNVSHSILATAAFSLTGQTIHCDSASITIM